MRERFARSPVPGTLAAPHSISAFYSIYRSRLFMSSDGGSKGPKMSGILENARPSDSEVLLLDHHPSSIPLPLLVLLLRLHCWRSFLLDYVLHRIILCDLGCRSRCLATRDQASVQESVCSHSYLLKVPSLICSLFTSHLTAFSALRTHPDRALPERKADAEREFKRIAE